MGNRTTLRMILVQRVLRLALDGWGHGVDLQRGRESVAGIFLGFLADVVSKLVFSCVWPRSCAIVGAKMWIWDLNIELVWLSVIMKACEGRSEVSP